MSEREYTNLIKLNIYGKPECERHGAMNCVNKERTIYRCMMCHVGIAFENDTTKLSKLIRDLEVFYGIENEAIVRLKNLVGEYSVV